MIKSVLLAAAAVAAVASSPAAAVDVSAVVGAFAAPASGGNFTTFDFNAPNLATYSPTITAGGFSYTTVGSVSLQTESLTGIRRAPSPSDGSPFVTVDGNSSITFNQLASNTAEYNAISLYVGSVDAYNEISILDRAGNVIQSFTGTQLLAPTATPDGLTSYRVTFTRSAGDAAFGGILISTSAQAGEFDNLVFAVPEPSTWALMLAGFGMVAMSMRARRRRTSVVFG
jgi:hypothetical protein